MHSYKDRETLLAMAVGCKRSFTGKKREICDNQEGEIGCLLIGQFCQEGAAARVEAFERGH